MIGFAKKSELLPWLSPSCLNNSLLSSFHSWHQPPLCFHERKGEMMPSVSNFADPFRHLLRTSGFLVWVEIYQPSGREKGSAWASRGSSCAFASLVFLRLSVSHLSGLWAYSIKRRLSWFLFTYHVFSIDPVHFPLAGVVIQSNLRRIYVLHTLSFVVADRIHKVDTFLYGLFMLHAFASVCVRILSRGVEVDLLKTWLLERFLVLAARAIDDVYLLLVLWSCKYLIVLIQRGAIVSYDWGLVGSERVYGTSVA